MQGYYKNAETTKNSFDSDGFFKTGDLGYFNEDGFFFISDRRSDMIRICNPNVNKSFDDACHAFLYQTLFLDNKCLSIND